MKKIVFGPFWMIYMLDYNLLVWSNFYFNSVNNLSIQDQKFQTHEGIISNYYMSRNIFLMNFKTLNKKYNI
jgi:hypothetical protein